MYMHMCTRRACTQHTHVHTRPQIIRLRTRTLAAAPSRTRGFALSVSLARRTTVPTRPRSVHLLHAHTRIERQHPPPSRPKGRYPASGVVAPSALQGGHSKGERLGEHSGEHSPLTQPAASGRWPRSAPTLHSARHLTPGPRSRARRTAGQGPSGPPCRR